MKLIKYKGKIYRTKKASSVSDCCRVCCFKMECNDTLSYICTDCDEANRYFKEVPDGIQEIR